MIRRTFASFILILVILILVGALSGVAVDLPGQWRAWRYSRPIDGLPRGHQAPVTAQLPFDLFARDDTNGRDFRLVDDHGQEVPYLLTVAQAESKTETLPSQILERSFVSGQFTQIVVGITDKHPPDQSHGRTLKQLNAEPWFNSYRISTPETDFMFWVETSVSDDAHQWRLIDARSPISRFRTHGLDGNQTIQFRGYSNQRYLRVRIFDPHRQFPVDNVEVLSHSSSEPRRLSILSYFSLEKTSGSPESRWGTDLNSPNLPISEVEFSTDQPQFFRAIRISTSSDRKDWSFRAAGEIYRFGQATSIKESLRIDFPECFARFWRADIIDGNDQPLSNLRLELRGLERQITFQTQPDRTYKLIYGNDRASSPQYDLARTLDRKRIAVLPLVTLGSEDVTSNYADPRPFTERHPRLLWLALGIAAVVIAYAALLALRAPKTST